MSTCASSVIRTNAIVIARTSDSVRFTYRLTKCVSLPTLADARDRCTDLTGLEHRSMSTVSLVRKQRECRKAGVLGLLTKFMPTNYNMVWQMALCSMLFEVSACYLTDFLLQLIFRTMNRDMRHPSTNEDNIAVLFRNKLMPIRSASCVYHSLHHLCQNSFW